MLVIGPTLWAQSCPAGTTPLGPLSSNSIANSTKTDWTGMSLTVPQFNPSQGTLNEVLVTGNGFASGSVNGKEHLWDSQRHDNADPPGRNITVTGPSGTATLNRIPTESLKFKNVPPLGSVTIPACVVGTDSFPPCTTPPPSAITDPATASVTLPAITSTSGLMPYEGTGNVTFTASANGQSSSRRIRGRASSRLTIRRLEQMLVSSTATRCRT